MYYSLLIHVRFRWFCFRCCSPGRILSQFPNWLAIDPIW